MTGPAAMLRAIKLLHTIVWGFFVLCIAAVWLFAARDAFGLAAVAAGVVAIEVAVLAVNHWRCPLTPIAARYTADRRANFDICLPEWLARYNKQIFGGLYLGGIAFALIRHG